ncbi:MAG: sulfatase-like hydrolase/transferase, partial [Polaribacter sp.]
EIDQFKLDNPDFEDLIRNSSYITNSTPVTNISDPTERAAKIEEFVEARIIYATMTVNMDKNIGRIVDELKTDMNVFNNTVIIFLSDNGGYRWSKGAVNYPLQQQKGSVLDGGHKVPMFVHWPDKITTNSTYDYQISALDIYPTLSNLAGATIPASKKLDGLDFMDKIIAGEKVREDDKPLYAVRPQNGFHNGGLASYPWKIVKTGNNGQWRLYNISNDPGETTNLRSTEPNAEQIIDDLLDKGQVLFTEFKDVVPAWYDNDGDGSGHPHSFLWADGTLPGYDRLFERSFDTQPNEIVITGTTNAIEGETDGVFTVSLPNGSNASQNIDVTYTVGGEATEGTDYATIPRTVTIANGTNSSQIIIDANTDSIDEGTETVTITLQSSTIETVNTTPADINILDDNNPTTLTAGDLAIVGYKAAAGNVAELAFVILKDINIGTTISISNRSWKDDGSFNLTGSGSPFNIDDVYSWTASNYHSIGTIFKLNRNGKITTVINGIETEVGTTVQTFGSDGDWDLSPVGDSVLIYNGDTDQHPDDSSTQWITGLNTNGVDNGSNIQSAGWAIGGGNAYCELPAALVGFDIDVTGGDISYNLWDINHGVYVGGATGNASTIRASINDYTNWNLDEANAYYLWRNTNTVNSSSGNINLGQVTLSANSIHKINFNIYPNPTEKFFNLELNETNTIEEVTIFSIGGKLIKKIIPKELNTKIDVSYLNSGVYIIKVKNEGGISIKKLIKK